MKIEINLTDSLSESTIELLENNLIYADEKIVSFKIYPEKILLNLNHDSGHDEIEKKVHDLISKLRNQKALPGKLKFTSTVNEYSYKGDAFSELVKRKDVISLQDGIVALSGLPLHMMEVLDRHLVEFAKTQKGKKILLPISVNFNDLLDSHYFDRTPQHAVFLSTIEETTRSISDFSKAFKDKKFAEKNLLKSPHSMCRSAVCLNCYPTMRNEVFKNGSCKVYTAEGRVFRHEYKMVNSLERLYEFSCREIIYLGDKDFVRARLNECEVWFTDFLSKLNLGGYIKSASDPFFVNNARALQFYQAAEDSKYEIRVTNPFTGIDVSIGSLNYHSNHFSKSYNIKFENDEYVMSGCVGFGLERTIFTVLAQYGTDQSLWPESLKQFFCMREFVE